MTEEPEFTRSCEKIVDFNCMTSANVSEELLFEFEANSSGQAHQPIVPSVYAGIMYIGVTILLCWNSILIAIDYFNMLYLSKQPKWMVFFCISYNISNVILCIVQAYYADWIPVAPRVYISYVINMLVLILIPLLELVGLPDSNIFLSFWLHCVLILFAGVGASVLQSAVYGFVGQLPPLYFRSLVSGVAISGVVMFILKLIAKAVFTGADRFGIRMTGIVFFSSSIVLTFGGIFMYTWISRHKVVVAFRRQAKAATAEHVHLQLGNNAHIQLIDEDAYDFETRKNTPKLKAAPVLYGIWPYGIALTSILFITLGLLPFFSTVRSVMMNDDWYHIVIPGIYMIGDLAGRMAVSTKPLIQLKTGWLFCLSRFLFIVPFILAYREIPLFQNDIIFLIVVFLLAVSNGYLVTVYMMLTPQSRPLAEREIAATIMVVFLVCGLITGSFFAFFVSFLAKL